MLKYIFLLIVLASVCPALAVSTSLPLASEKIPQGLGVNIHFTRPLPGEMKMIADAGFTFVRMDFDWHQIEKTRGEYDWSAYDGLLKSLDKFNIRALLILDYSNKLYDNGDSPRTDEGREAFANWAAAGVRHFKNRGVLWEMYNEPNGFWRPKPNTAAYVKLAQVTAKAIHEAEPNEIFIGPAVAGMNFDFLEACFKGGLLDYWSAVTCHPYRQSPPETVVPDYDHLRNLIAKYAPKGKFIPIYSGEWGYSSVWKNYDEKKQGEILPRQWLTNLMSGVPLSIWYDWRDDGNNATEAERHFGTVHYQFHGGKNPPFEPKPAYLAAKTLTTQLRGYRFALRIPQASKDDYVLLFTRGEESKLVAWTTSAAHVIQLSGLIGTFDVVSHTGQVQPAIAAQASRLDVPVGNGPIYILPQSSNDSLKIFMRPMK